MGAGLEGLRVVELSVGMAGAMAGMALTENGAEVVKVEPPSGDPSRGTPAFHVWHRGKRSVVLDLGSPDGRTGLGTLLAWADAAVTDLSAGAIERLGLGDDDVAAAHPHLVFASISGFGRNGPLSDVPGYEQVVAAVSGRMASLNGYREEPIFTPAPIAAFGAGMLAAQAILAGVHARTTTGRGTQAATSLLHALSAYDMTSGFGNRAHTPPEPGQVYGVMPLGFMTARCKDGRFLQMCSRAPHLFRNWMRVLGLESLYDDPAYARMPEAFPTEEALWRVRDLAQAKMAERTADEWLEIFEREDVGADPFLSPTEYLHCDQAIATGRAQVVDDPVLGRTLQIGPMGNFSATPATIGQPAPALGEHTDAALAAAEGSPRRVEETGAAVRHPLEGVTVVEAATMYAAPFGMTLLAELGARVIKVEAPGGDPSRRNWTTDYTKATAGKESIVLDLKTDEGRQILYRLVEKADIFIHNFRPGVPDRLKIDVATLRGVNPRLVYLYGGAFGSTGPWARRPGYHSSPNAIAGVGTIECGRGNAPINRTYGDPAGALAVGTVALVGLHARERTGEGQYVETTMLSSLAYVVSSWSVDYEGKPEGPMPDQGQHGFDALCRLYEAEEGWLFLMARRPSEWERLVEVLGSPELASDRRFATAEARAEHDDVLTDLIAGIVAKRPAEEWERVLLAAGVAGVRADGISHMDFMLNHPHVREVGVSVEDELADGRRFWRAGPSVTFGGSSPREAPSLGLGSHTDALLRELGYDEARIADLRDRGVTPGPGGAG